MKRLFIFCTFLFFAVTAHAEEEKKEVEYRVTIEVTYNAVSIAKANAIVADAIKRHKEACKNKVIVEKVGANDDVLTSTTVLYDNLIVR